MTMFVALCVEERRANFVVVVGVFLCMMDLVLSSFLLASILCRYSC
jgi:hypothetical protein